MTPTTCDLLIVGAGPAGLAHGFWRARQEPDLELLIVEQQARAGGWMQTEQIDGYRCELGPQGLRPDDDSEAFLAALGIEDQIVPANPEANRRFLARGGKLHALPSGPGALFSTDIFTFLGKLSLFMEPFRRRRNRPEESLAEFVGRRFGDQAVPMAEALASGVFGGDAHSIEMAAAFPAVKELETEHGSLIRGMIARRKTRRGKPKRPPLHSFVGGMHTMIEALRQRLGDRLRTGAGVVSLQRSADRWQVGLADGATIIARELVLGVPARVAADLLASLSPALANELRGIQYASIANIYLGYPRQAGEAQLDGFGYLIDRREDSPLLGAIYCSAIFPDCAPADGFLVRVMAGGALRPQTLDESDAELLQRADTMLRSYTGLSATRQFGQVRRAIAAIPQFQRGHRQRVVRIREHLEQLSGLQLVGNSYDAISVVGQLGTP